MGDKKTADVVVVGGGPGGYVCAIRLAQLGKRVALVEREPSLGGVCLNWGCIPSKALIQLSSLYERARKGHEMGLVLGGASVDLGRFQTWKRGIVSRLSGGIERLLKGNKIERLRGEGSLAGGRAVEVRAVPGSARAEGGGPLRIEAGAIVLATGAKSVELEGLPFDGKRVLGARELLDLETLPGRTLVVGAGVIGLELGTALAKLGSRVTVVEILDTILFGVEAELSRWVARKLKMLEVEIQLESRVVGFEEKSSGLEVRVEDARGGNARVIEVDRIFVAAGFRPNTEGLGLDRAGVQLDPRGFVRVNRRLETSAPGVLAIGDLVGPPFLAHKASKEGKVAAEVVAGLPSELDYRAMPGAIFTDPEIATVGLTEEQARKEGREVVVGKFPFAALGRAETLGERPAPGFTKVVSEKGSGLLLGVHIVGAEATELISEAALAIEMGATAEDLAATIHPHPTLPEALMEAAEAAATGRAIHVLSG